MSQTRQIRIQPPSDTGEYSPTSTMGSPRKKARPEPETLDSEELAEWIEDECYPSVAISHEAQKHLRKWLTNAERWCEQRMQEND